MKLPHAEVKFYPEVKSPTGLGSLRVSCKRDLSYERYNYANNLHHHIIGGVNLSINFVCNLKNIFNPIPSTTPFISSRLH